MEVIFLNWETIPFTENYIKQLHKILLKYSDKDERHRGEYKKFPNNVIAFDASGKELGTIFETTSPFDTIKEMQDLINWISLYLNNKEDLELHPLILIAIFVIRFLAIHPFSDGNGRLSRALTTLLLLKFGYNFVSYISFERIIEENKDSYYLALRKTQSTLKLDVVEWDYWLMFFLQSILKLKKRLNNKIRDEIDRFSKLPKSTEFILELIIKTGKVTMSEILLSTNDKRSTVKLKLNELIERKLIVRHGKGRGVWYSRS